MNKISIADQLSNISSEDAEFSSSLQTHQNEIINSLGGLSNVLQMCLRYESQDSYQSTVSQNTLQLISTKLLQNPTTASSTSQPSDNSDNNDSKENEENTKMRKRDKAKAQLKFVMADLRANSSTQEWMKKDDVIKVDASSNMFFYCCSKTIATHLYYIVTLSNWYPFLGMFALVPLALTIIFTLVVEDETLQLVFWNLFKAYFAIYSMFYGFGFNIGIIKGVLTTFDFWYKLFQCLLAIFATIGLQGSKPAIINVIGDIALFFGLVFPLLLFDAWNLHFKAKVLVLTIMTVVLGLFYSFIYFLVNDQIWDPFKSFNSFDGRTAISLKSVLLSALLNVILYTVKPLISLVSDRSQKALTKIVSKLKKKETGDNGPANVVVVPSALLLKRPFFEWTNATKEEGIAMKQQLKEMVHQHAHNTKEKMAMNKISNQSKENSVRM